MKFKLFSSCIAITAILIPALSASSESLDRSFKDTPVSELSIQTAQYTAKTPEVEQKSKQITPQRGDNLVLVATVTSLNQPAPGQTQRSSNNFRIPRDLPAGTVSLYWKVISQGQENRFITFNVKWDRNNRKDPFSFSGQWLRNRSSTKVETGDRFYIANPRQARSSFDVEVYAVVASR